MFICFVFDWFINLVVCDLVNLFLFIYLFILIGLSLVDEHFVFPFINILLVF